MPRTSDVDVYRGLIAAQRDGVPAGPATTVVDVPAATTGPFADVLDAITRSAAGPSVGGTPLVVRTVTFDGPPADTELLRRRFPDAVAVLIVLGDLDEACAWQDTAGYARLLVRAGAAAEAGRAAAAGAGFTVRLDHTAGRILPGGPAAGESPLTPLCTVVLSGGGDD
jgi:hypothetical protein